MKVVFGGSFAVLLADAVRAWLSVDCDIVLEEDEAAVPKHLGDADVLVTTRFTQAMADAATRLRLVQVPGAGYDRIDQSALPLGVRLANVFGHEAGIAEYVVGAMIAQMRSLVRVDTRLREGRWDSQFAVGQAPPPLWPELGGKTLGLLGFGHIGQAVARRAAAFDMHLCAIRQNVPSETPPGLTFIGGMDRLDELLEQSDVVLVTLPLTDQTRGLMDANRLQSMKSTALVINVARAEIFDETALYQALATRNIAGAVLDVWYRYPTTPEPELPATEPFHQLDNVLMTPHSSGWTEGMFRERGKLIAENISRAAAGDVPLNEIVSPASA